MEKHSVKAIYASVQPWSAAVIGAKLKTRYGLPLIVDFRDPWSFSTSRHWASSYLHRRDRAMEEEVFRAADAIVSVTPGIVKRYRELYPFAARKMHLIYNGFDQNDFSETAPAAPSKRFTLGFTGRLNSVDEARKCGGWLKRRLGQRNCDIDFTTHSLRYLSEAVAQLVKERPSLREEFVMEVAGNVPADNQRLTEQLGVADMFKFHGLVPHKDAIDLVGRSDAVFLPMMSERDGRRSFNASGKVFEYLAQRKPVFAAVPEGDAADLVRGANCGWVVRGNDVDGQAVLLRELVEKKSAGTLDVQPDDEFINRFERSRLAGELAELVRAVTRSN